MVSVSSSESLIVMKSEGSSSSFSDSLLENWVVPNISSISSSTFDFAGRLFSCVAVFPLLRGIEGWSDIRLASLGVLSSVRSGRWQSSSSISGWRGAGDTWAEFHFSCGSEAGICFRPSGSLSAWSLTVPPCRFGVCFPIVRPPNFAFRTLDLVRAMMPGADLRASLCVLLDWLAAFDVAVGFYLQHDWSLIHYI